MLKRVNFLLNSQLLPLQTAELSENSANYYRRISISSLGGPKAKKKKLVRSREIGSRKKKASTAKMAAENCKPHIHFSKRIHQISILQKEKLGFGTRRQHHAQISQDNLTKILLRQGSGLHFKWQPK